MKKFMLLHFGFEKPTPEIMGAWEKWFESIADKQIDQGGFSGGREISKSGTNDLPWGMESITGYNIIEAKDLDAAETSHKTIHTSQASGSMKLGRCKAQSCMVFLVPAISFCSARMKGAVECSFLAFSWLVLLVALVVMKSHATRGVDRQIA